MTRPPDDKFAGFSERVTYLIDPQGKIAKSYLVGRDDIDGHADRVLADIRSLS